MVVRDRLYSYEGSVLFIQHSWSSVASVTQLFVTAARLIRELQIWWENLNINALELATTGLSPLCQ